ncbi:hypothetical protein K0M31_004571 [Melipona bicolor]|uniref:Uncharacterized protein n=1 Tax=Melipona bicolor TaxID=60889 RepID=A0AA40FY20_9HYME|nr:hypothetical protein K0M31_004571 [Melipona bicolor]
MSVSGTVSQGKEKSPRNAAPTMETGLVEEGGFVVGWKLRRQGSTEEGITTETPHGRSVIKMGITFPVMSFREFAPPRMMN